jgi:hypothetical protein
MSLLVSFLGVVVATQRIYLETTMFNFYFDQQYPKGHLATIAMFEAIGRSEYEAYTSRYVVLELQDAPEPKQTNMLKLIEKYNITSLDSSDEIDKLAKLYINNKIIPEKYSLDASHIACATINNLDIILSFNYNHINKLKTKIMTETINRREGYKGIAICTPMELLDNEV